MIDRRTASLLGRGVIVAVGGSKAVAAPLVGLLFAVVGIARAPLLVRTDRRRLLPRTSFSRVVPSPSRRVVRRPVPIAIICATATDAQEL